MVPLHQTCLISLLWEVIENQFSSQVLCVATRGKQPDPFHSVFFFWPLTRFRSKGACPPNCSVQKVVPMNEKFCFLPKEFQLEQLSKCLYHTPPLHAERGTGMSRSRVRLSCQEKSPENGLLIAQETFQFMIPKHHCFFFNRFQIGYFPSP